MHRLRIDAASESLADVRSFVRSAAVAEGAGEDAAADLVQAVDEAVTNVVVHGYRGRAGPIEIDLAVRGGALVARIVDAAPRFDPTRVGPPDLDVSLRDRRPGGMGVHLMRSMTDEVRHRSRPDGGNELTLVKRIGTKV